MLIVMGLVLIGFVGNASAEGRIKGYMFGDYYWVASADDGETKLPEQRNAFQLRRLYLTYENQIADDFSIRYRLEAKDAGFGKGSKMVPFVKHGYLKWSDAVGESDLYIGLSGTPTWSASESAWGYRSIEKTVMDLNKIGSSADLGVGLKGSAGNIGYHVMIGNGPGQAPEDDHGKKFYGQVRFAPSDGLTLVGYADFNMRPAEQNQVTFAGFVGISQGDLTLGLEPFMRINQSAAADGDDVTITGVSLFGRLPLAEQWNAFGRVDAVSDDSDDTTDLLVVAGLDYVAAKNVHIMPNLYLGLPDGPDPNIQARVTCFYKF
jgi:hypothetical protein